MTCPDSPPGVCAIRWGRPVLDPFGVLVQHGRCRYCGATQWRYAAVDNETAPAGKAGAVSVDSLNRLAASKDRPWLL